MKNYSNIEKSAFHRGEYIGYAGGEVYRICKANSSYGTWFAYNQNEYNDQIFAFGLYSLSQKLTAIANKLAIA
jgi:outer membrane protein assembly factor BamB